MAYRQPRGIPSSVLCPDRSVTLTSAREAGAEVAKVARLGVLKPRHPALMKTQVCRYFGSRGHRCRRGDACPYAHGDADLRQAPDLTKTALCLAFMGGACPYSAEECKFAHGVADKRSLKAVAAAARIGNDRRRAGQPWPQGEDAEATRRHCGGRGGRAQQGSGLHAEDLTQLRSRRGATSPHGPHTGNLGKDVFDDGLDTASTTDGSNRASSEPSPGGPKARFGRGSSDARWGAPSAFEHEDDPWGRFGGSGWGASSACEHEGDPWSSFGTGGDAPAGAEHEEEPWGSWGGSGGHVPGAFKFKEHGGGDLGGAGGTGFSPPKLLVEAEGRTLVVCMVPDLRSVLLPEELERLLVQAMPSSYSD
mmetsp:Transcript_21549/g.67282  ORF Transcript_21549/g.67282 Transcript_21549/m.67282 type:complete len:364 (+) Transcript_21549:3-1094(+)